MNQTNDTILQAIDIVVNARLAQLHKDTTIKGTIVDASNSSKGKYIIKYQNSLFDVYTDSTDVVYKEDESIYITVPSGDMNNKKFILGKVKDLELSEYVDIVDPNQQYELVGVPFEAYYGIAQENVVYIPGYKGSKEDDIEIDENTKQSKYKSIFLNNSLSSSSIEAYSEKYEFIQFSASFQYLPKPNTDIEEAGNYGLEFRFLTTKTDKDNNPIYVTYVFDTESMYGNPSVYHEYIERTVTLQVEKGYLKNLISIQLFSEGFNRASANKDILNEQDIFVKNVKISFAQKINENETYLASILTPYGTYLDNTPNNQKKIILNSCLRNQGNLISENDYKVYWFEYDNKITVGSTGYQSIGGRSWKFINNNKSLEYDNTKGTIQWLSKRIKMVIAYGKDIIRNREITIYKTHSEASLYKIAYDKDYTNTITLKVVDNNNAELGTQYTYAWSYTDINGQLFQLKETINKVTENANNILSDRNYTCTIYSGNMVIDVVSYLITTKVADSLFIVEFTTPSNGVFLYKENGYIELEEFLTSKQLGFVLKWSTEPQSYKYQWLIENPEYMEKDGNGNVKSYDFYVQPQNDNTLATDVTPKNSMVKYLASSMLRGNDATVNKFIDYKIDAQFSRDKTANKILLEINVNDVNYYFPFTFSFSKQGDIGTNGTDYQMRVVQTSSNITYWNGAKDANGNALTDITTATYEIDVYHNGVQLDKTKIGQDKVKLYVAENLKNKNILQYTGEDEEGKPVTKLAATYSGGIITVTRQDTYKTFDSNRLYNILTIQILQDDDFYLTYHLPIEINYNTSATYHNFPTVIYDALGKRPTYYHGDLNTFYVKKDSSNENIILDYSLVNSTSLFSIIERNGTYSFIANSQYDGKKAYNVLQVSEPTKDGITPTIYVPIMAIVNQYGLANINDWDGNSIVVDNDKGVVYSPQIAAGNKHDDNTFSGVILGEYIQDDTSASQTPSLGLWGFSHGKSSFGFNADGTAYVGVSGAGQLQITTGLDENNKRTYEAILQSGNYKRGTVNEGMLINLTEGTIDAPGFQLGTNSATFSGTLKGPSGTFGTIEALEEFNVGDGNFVIDSEGHVTINDGTIVMKAVAGLDDTVKNITQSFVDVNKSIEDANSAIDNLSKRREVPDYIQTTYISSTDIITPTLYANTIKAPLFELVKYFVEVNGEDVEVKNDDFITDDDELVKVSPVTYGFMGAATGVSSTWDTVNKQNVTFVTEGVAMGYGTNIKQLRNYIICTSEGIRLSCDDAFGNNAYKLWIQPSGIYYQKNNESKVQLTGATYQTAVFG